VDAENGARADGSVLLSVGNHHGSRASADL
jgi:hypothetical protein